MHFLARLFLLRRLFGGHGHRGHRRRHGRPRRSGFGFHGPFPSYSRRTRGGGRVSVGGCCLPIPLALTLTLAAAAGRALAGRR